MTDQPRSPAGSDPDEIRCALPTFMTCGCNHLTGCQYPAPEPARTVPDNPAASSDTADSGLREQYAEALWAANGPAAAEDDNLDAVMGVHDRRMEQLRRERDLAIAHDRQPYPTAWAYEQTCKARETHRQRADKAEAALARVRDLAADMHGITGAHTWARWLDTALDGPADTTPPAEE